MRIRYLIRFSLLMTGFALTTFGILTWQKIGFDLNDMWPFTESGSRGFSSHPIYLIVLGMALIPPTLWEIFLLEQNRDKS